MVLAFIFFPAPRHVFFPGGILLSLLYIPPEYFFLLQKSGFFFPSDESFSRGPFPLDIEESLLLATFGRAIVGSPVGSAHLMGTSVGFFSPPLSRHRDTSSFVVVSSFQIGLYPPAVSHRESWTQSSPGPIS